MKSLAYPLVADGRALNSIDSPTAKPENWAMEKLVFLTVSALFSLSLFAAPAKTTVCLPSGRSEFLQILIDTARDHQFFEKRNLEVTVDYTKKKHADEWKIGGSRITKPRLLDYKVANRVAEGDPKCNFGASNMERFLADPRGQKETRPLFVSNFGEQYDTHLLVSKTSKLKSSAGLRGKKLRIGQVPTYVAMLGLLESQGMTMKDVKVDYGNSGSEKLAGLNDGSLDAATTYLPAAAYLLGTGKVRILEPNIVSRFVGKKIPHSLLIVNSDYAAKNPAVLSSFNEAILESYAYVMRNRAEIFYSFSRHNQRGDEWKIGENEKADVEKAASFVGQVALIDLSKDSDERNEVYCGLKNYGGILVQRGLLERQVDLASWLGVKAGKAQGCPVQNITASNTSI